MLKKCCIYVMYMINLYRIKINAANKKLGVKK